MKKCMIPYHHCSNQTLSNINKIVEKKNKTKEEKIRIKMYDFDLVIITYKHITSSYLRMKNLLFQSKGRILSWTT